jgi:hypothetical protein
MNTYEKIESLYKEPKSKGFITHLLRSFFPIGKASELFSRPNDKTTLKCAITGVSLCSKEDKINVVLSVKDDLVDDMIQSMKTAFSNKPHTPSENVTAISKTFNDMSVAVSSPNSDKYLSEEAYKELYNFYATQILKGDKNIAWIAKNEIAKQRISNLENYGVSFTPKEKKVVHKAVESSGGMS